MPGWLKLPLLGIAGLLVLVLLALVVLTQTDIGREQVRGFMEDRISQQLGGTVEIGSLSGNLLNRAVLEDVVVGDSFEPTVARIDRLVVDYPLGTLTSFLPVVGGGGPVELESIVVVGPEVMLVRGPEGRWNFERLLPADTAAPDTVGFEPPDVRIEELVVEGGRVVVRTPWSPPAGLEGEARREAIERALEGRERVVEVADGYQRIVEVRGLDATLRSIGPVRPDAALGALVDSLGGVVLAYDPPALTIENLSTRLRLSGDSITARELRAEFGPSVLTGGVGYARETGEVTAKITANPLALEDLEWLRPRLPAGGGTFRLDLSGPPNRLRVRAREVDLDVGMARLAGHADVTLGDSVAVGESDVTIEGLRMALVERLVPDARIPVDGTASGRVRLNGTRSDLKVQAGMEFRREDGGLSRLEAHGGIAALPEGVRARDLRLKLEPLRLDLVEALGAELPVEGTLRGVATVNGAMGERVRADLDLAHHGPAGVTRARGDLTLLGTDPARFTADLRLPRVALGTVDWLVDGLALQGTASGRIEARGTARDLSFDGRLALADGGSLDVRGSYDLTRARAAYRLDARLDRLDLAAASPELRSTALSGTVEVEGRGTDPATARGRVTASLSDATLDPAGTGSLRLRARAEDGLAVVERAEVRLASATAEVEGRFGLAEGRAGELEYRLRVNSLSDFAHRLPGDAGVVRVRPAEQARILAEARADSAREARRTRVERAATGFPAEPELEADTVEALAGDSVAGSVRLEGRVAGRLGRFDGSGTVRVRDLVLAGAAVGAGRVEYQWDDARTDSIELEVDGSLRSLRVRGFAYDSVSVDGALRGGLRGGRGEASLAVHQDPERDFRVRAGYALDMQGANEVRLRDAVLRFGERRWTEPGRALVRWTDDGTYSVQDLDLRDGEGGRIFVEGTLRADGGVTADLEVDQLPITSVLGVLQDTVRAGGMLALDARLEGTLESPRLDAELGLRRAEYRDRELPALRMELAYQPGPGLLLADAWLEREEDDVGTAEVRMPVRIGVGEDGPVHVYRDRPLRAELELDSLSLSVPGAFIEAVSDVRGTASGRLALGGTLAEPVPEGELGLELDSIGAEPLGVTLTGVAGRFRVREDQIVVDTLTARTGVGRIRVGGTIRIDTLTAPVFDLEARAREALVLENDRGELRVSADLDIEGPSDGLTVRGELEVREGVIYIPQQEEEPLDLESPGRAAAAAAALESGAEESANPVIDNLEVDVRIEIARNTWVRSEAVNVEIFTPDQGPPLTVHLDNRRGGLVLRGTVRSDRGEYIFAGRRMEVETGIATFVGDPEISPLIQLSMTHEIPRTTRQALVVEVDVTGHLRDPEIQLSSNAQPPLSQSQLLNLLVLGGSSASLLGSGGSGLSGDGAGGLGALATQQLGGVALGSLMGEVVGGLQEAGLDVARIAPADLPGELAFDSYLTNFFRGTEIELGEYLSPQLFVGAQVRASALPGLRAEYRLGRGFSGRVVWEPRFFPRQPMLREMVAAEQARVLGAFLEWTERF